MLVSGDDASTGPDAGDLDTGRGCGRMIGVGSGVGSADMTHLKGLPTSTSPGVPSSVGSAAFAASVAQRVVSVVMLSSGNTGTGKSRHVNRIPGKTMGVQVKVRACAGGTSEHEHEMNAHVESRTKE